MQAQCDTADLHAQLYEARAAAEITGMIIINAMPLSNVVFSRKVLWKLWICGDSNHDNFALSLVFGQTAPLNRQYASVVNDFSCLVDRPRC